MAGSSGHGRFRTRGAPPDVPPETTRGCRGGSRSSPSSPRSWWPSWSSCCSSAASTAPSTCHRRRRRGRDGLTGGDAQLTRATCLAMDRAAWAVLVPLALATLVTGLIQSLGSAWGLLRHYGVIIKLLLASVATVVLLLYTRTLDLPATTAAQPDLSPGDLALLRTPSVVLHATAALLVLGVAVVLPVYKPRGLTRYGRRRRAARRAARPSQGQPPTGRASPVSGGGPPGLTGFGAFRSGPPVPRMASRTEPARSRT
jgi:hypothetical protein